MNTLTLYAQSQAQAPSSENTAVAENNVGATAQSSNVVNNEYQRDKRYSNHDNVHRNVRG